MQAGPHPLMERLVGPLIPPQAREAVLGDLAERYRSGSQYVLAALGVLPAILLGKIRRTTSLAAFGLQTLILFGCMGGFDIPSQPRDVPSWARAAIPSAVAILALVLRDAYRLHDGWSVRRAFRDVQAVVFAVAACQLIAMSLVAIGAASPAWVFAPERVVVMTISVLPTLFVIRLGLGFEQDMHRRVQMSDRSAAELRADYARFASGIGARNLLEAAVFGLIAAVSALYLAVVHGFSNALLGWCWIAGQAAVCIFVLTRASARSMPEQASFAALIEFYRAEIDRQRRFVRIMWWWYLWPLCLGAGLPALSRAAENYASAILGLASSAVVVGFVAWFTRERARRYQEEMDNLLGVRESA